MTDKNVEITVEKTIEKTVEKTVETTVYKTIKISENRKTPSKPDAKTDKKTDEDGEEKSQKGEENATPETMGELETFKQKVQEEIAAKAESSPADPIDASGVTPRRGGSSMAPVDSSSALRKKIDDQSDEKVDEKSNNNKGKAEKKTDEEADEEIDNGHDSAARLIHTLNNFDSGLGDEVFELLCQLRTAGKYTSEEMLRYGRSTCLLYQSMERLSNFKRSTSTMSIGVWWTIMASSCSKALSPTT